MLLSLVVGRGDSGFWDSLAVKLTHEFQLAKNLSSQNKTNKKPNNKPPHSTDSLHTIIFQSQAGLDFLWFLSTTKYNHTRLSSLRIMHSLKIMRGV